MSGQIAVPVVDADEQIDHDEIEHDHGCKQSACFPLFRRAPISLEQLPKATDEGQFHTVSSFFERTVFIIVFFHQNRKGAHREMKDAIIDGYINI